MPPLKIVCLANSWKLGERCIAGIDITSRKWVRPVCDQLYPEDGRVPRSVRLIEGREPNLLDVLQIPLAETGNNFEFECENRSVLPGQWKLLGKVQPNRLMQHCENYENFSYILHNSIKYVNPSDLKKLPFNQRRTLQLVKANSLSVAKSSYGWRGCLQTNNGQILRDARITDPCFVDALESGYRPCGTYLVTVSLSMPWAPDDWEGEQPCWKLIAGLIKI